MEYRPYYMAKHWCLAGHNVTIIAASQSHVRSIQPGTTKRFEEDVIDGIRYIWLNTPSYNGNGIGRAFNMIVFLYRLFLFSRKIIEKANPDAVIASSTYPLDIFPAYWISSRSGAKLIYEVHDLWPLSPIELGNYSRWNPLILIMQYAEDFAYKKSFQVVSILPLTLDHMIDHGLKPDKFNYIPNGIETEEWNENLDLPSELTELITSLKHKSKKVISYTGSLGLANALNCLIDSAKILEDENIAFLIIGKGPQKEKLLRKINDLNISNVIILEPIRKELIPTLLAEMDILYIGLQKQSLFRFGISPNKLIDYMMSAKPIVQSIKAGNDIVSEANCGITIEPENPRFVAEAIKNILNLSDLERAKLGENGKRYVIKNHNYSLLANKFIQVIMKNVS